MKKVENNEKRTISIKPEDKPFVIPGKKYEDERGFVFHNNNFDLKNIRRMYEIQNLNKHILRGWKGHLIESRWFLCTNGMADIKVKNLLNESQLGNKEYVFSLKCRTGDILYVPKNHATLITLDHSDSKTLCFSDYSFNNRENDIRL